MNTDVIIHSGQVAGAVIAILTLGGMLVRYFVVRPIKAYIDHATYPIQPNANGGKSLPDVALAIGELRGMLQAHIDTHKTDNN